MDFLLNNRSTDLFEDNITLTSDNNNYYNYTLLPHNENETGTDIVKEEVYISLTEFLFTGVGVSLVTLIGVVGNIISLIVLSRPRLRSSVTFLLLGLTVCDLIFLVVLFIIQGVKALVFDYIVGISKAGQFFEFLTHYLSVVVDCAQTGSVYFTVAIALDRYIAVCWPFKSRYLCTWRRAQYVSGVVILVSIAFQGLGHLQSFPQKSPEQFNENREKLKEMCFFSVGEYNAISNEYSELLDTLYENHFLRWPYLLFMVFIPFSTLIVLNSFIYNEIRKANKKRQNLTQKQATEISFAVVSIMIVVLFFVCNAAFFVMAFVHTFYECLWHQWKIILLSIDTFLVSVNASTNFLIYCAMGGNFRKQLKQILKNSTCCSWCIFFRTSQASSNSLVDSGGPTNCERRISTSTYISQSETENSVV